MKGLVFIMVTIAGLGFYSLSVQKDRAQNAEQKLIDFKHILYAKEVCEQGAEDVFIVKFEKDAKGKFTKMRTACMKQVIHNTPSNPQQMKI